MKADKIITILSAAAVLPMTMLISGASAADAFTAAAELTRSAAYLSAGVPITEQSDSIPEAPDTVIDEIATPIVTTAATTTVTTAEPLPDETVEPQPSEDIPEENTARVITLNITPFDDMLDYSAEGNYSGAIQRKTYGSSQSDEYITLASGAQVRNCTYDSNDALAAAAAQLPELKIELNSPEPQVLIVHTHATESFEPYQRSYYDEQFPSRSQDPSHNMIAVGEVLAETLAENGISVVHDGTLHDYPAYTGSYDRSEETIRNILSDYPSIKIVIDLHRDAIADADGTRVAPTVQINGKSAAQFMIIAGCDDGRFNMPLYMENFKLAALLQNSAETLYPSLARPVLFDYRNYNQHITTGSLLIEIGSHANSLDEALYTAELIGESMASALALLE